MRARTTGRTDRRDATGEVDHLAVDLGSFPGQFSFGARQRRELGALLPFQRMTAIGVVSSRRSCKEWLLNNHRRPKALGVSRPLTDIHRELQRELRASAFGQRKDGSERLNWVVSCHSIRLGVARPLWGVDSTGRCNACLKALCRCLVAQCLAWSLVELPCYLVQPVLAVHR
jgi:hypothetical protein